MQEILVDEWGFDGFVVSDWGGSNDHALGVKNGSHLEMPGTGKSGMYDIIHAVENGDLDEAVLDQRLDELLNVIFSTHQATEDAKGKTFDVEAHHNLARKAAEESIVLLKNEDQILPLKPGTKVAVIGDFAKTPRYQGAGSSLVNPAKQPEAILDVIGSTDLVSGVLVSDRILYCYMYCKLNQLYLGCSCRNVCTGMALQYRNNRAVLFF